jgi:GTPase SAR1 family protein
VTKASKFVSALDEIPELLLDSEQRGMRDGARASLEALAALKSDPSVIVVIGGGGSGKSSVVNALVGADVAVVSPVRPTTVRVSVIGRSDPELMGEAAEHMYSDLVRDGIVVIDTPSWDHERDAVVTAVTHAHTIVVVLTAARYGDAVTSQIVRGLPDRANVVIVANRMPGDPDENDDVLDDIESTLDTVIFAQILEGDPVVLPSSLISGLPMDTAFAEAKSSHEHAAADLGRRIARSLAASAAELSEVKRSLVDTAVPSCGIRSARIGEDWAATREALINIVVLNCGSFDNVIVDMSGAALAVRIRDGLATPDVATMSTTLDRWRMGTVDAFRRRSTTRWRRRATFDLLDHWSWMLVLDPQARPPRRVRRAMHGGLEVAVQEAGEQLLSILDAVVRERPAQWESAVSHVGDYRPGVLFAASDALDGGEMADE